MPALPNVPQVIKNVLRFTVSEDGAALIRFFLKYSGTAPSNAQLATFAAGIGAAYAANMTPLAGEGVILNDVQSTDLTSSTSGEGFSTEDAAGTRSGDPCPASACVLESLEILRRYRGGHPRIYWPLGIAGDLVNYQEWESSFLTSVASGLNAFYAAVEALTWTGGSIVSPVNVSFYEGFTNRTGPTGREKAVATPRSTALVDDIVSSLIRAGVAQQRRRLLGLA